MNLIMYLSGNMMGTVNYNKEEVMDICYKPMQEISDLIEKSSGKIYSLVSPCFSQN